MVTGWPHSQPRIWLTGPKRWSNSSRHIEPATIGEITVGMINSATKIWRPGRRSRNSCAMGRPKMVSSGSAIAVIRKVWPSAPQKRVFRSSRA